MFIKHRQRPFIEFAPDEGQKAPTLVHYFSDRGEPFASVLPQLTEGGEGERVLVVSSPLSELLDETIRLHRHPDYAAPIVAEKDREFFAAVRASLEQALAKLDAIQFARMDDEEEDG